MKTTTKFLGFFAVLMLISSLSFAQDDQRPEFVTVTTMHWNMDNDDFKMDEWKAMENEYMEKVTKKNEYVLVARFYMHRFTESNTELLYVQAYKNWADIENAQKRNDELEKEAWPDEASRKAYFKNRDSYYQMTHSDEIYATFPGAKVLSEKPTKDLILYVRKSYFTPNEEGSDEEFMKFYNLWVNNVINKNDFVLGYYPNVHAWGADKSEFVEAFYVDTMANLAEMFNKNQELYEANISQADRDELEEKFSKYFTGEHGDYIYTYVHDVGK